MNGGKNAHARCVEGRITRLLPARLDVAAVVAKSRLGPVWGVIERFLAELTSAQYGLLCSNLEGLEMSRERGGTLEHYSYWNR